jgi:nitroimidazol reductase NimA-like FMN-containing flavoprotein (pyridoxamine 5'-phosphate oxidase superfamily)
MRYRSRDDVPTRASQEAADVSNEIPGLSPRQRADAEAVLTAAPVCYLAVVDNEPPDRGRGRSSAVPAGGVAGAPYVVPINFVYDAATAHIFFHTGAGRKTRALAANPDVCLALADSLALSVGPGPCQDGFSYKSVLVWGRAARIEDREERERVLRAIVAKYDPQAAGGAFEERAFEQALVYEVAVDAISYKERRPRHPE